MHLLLLLENGQLWSCGKNSYNQVDNTGADQLVLTQMEYAKSVRTYKCAAASLSTMIITGTSM
jgi:alpha-tubulin suppressor-like RCC1 family protein